MRFTEFKGNIRKKNAGMTKLEGEIREFMKMNIRVAKVTFTKVEYKDHKSCYEALRRAIKKNAFPVDVVTRKGEVFIINKEID